MLQVAEADVPESSGGVGRSGVESARFLERVDGILPLLRENTLRAEEIRRVPEENIRAMTEVGVFRATQPRRWGGLEVDPSAWEEALVRLGSACPSSGWVGGILGGHAWYVSMYSEQVQRDLWGADSDVRMASSFAPTGKVERVGDGFRLTGRWKFLSGVDHAGWVCLAGIIPDAGDGPEYRVFVVPAADYTIDQDSWRVSGLQGSGSKDITVDAVVPEYRTQTVAEVYYGNEPGKVVNTGPIFQLPWLSMWAYNIASPAIGAAVGALDAFIGDNRRRASALLGTVAAQNAAVQVRLAEAMTLVSDARGRIPRTWDDIYADVVAGVPVSNEKRARARFEASYTVGQCLAAVNRVFEVGGGGVLDSGKLFQHYMRGLMGMRNHPYAVFENWAGLYATTLFGFPLDPPFTKEHLGCLV
jgi:3-hydroxy-9,10-secoandrosta-1,3,5(10)-triene-9,17-dione monooxygenase